MKLKKKKNKKKERKNKGKVTGYYWDGEKSYKMYENDMIEDKENKEKR